MKYSNCKMAIMLFLQGEKTTRLGQEIQSRAYINERCPGKATLIDESRRKIGRQSLLNRLRSLRSINFDWTQGISVDRLRINLKKTFFS